MIQVLVYQPDNAPVAIVTPCDCGLTLEQIGRKDIPSGLPFWLVDKGIFPEDQTFRNAWRLDVSAMGAPLGIGEKPEEEILA